MMWLELETELQKVLEIPRGEKVELNPVRGGSIMCQLSPLISLPCLDFPSFLWTLWRQKVLDQEIEKRMFVAGLILWKPLLHISVRPLPEFLQTTGDGHLCPSCSWVFTGCVLTRHKSSFCSEGFFYTHIACFILFSITLPESFRHDHHKLNSTMNTSMDL